MRKRNPKFDDLVARREADTLDVHPDLLRILIGVNDGDKIQELKQGYDKPLADTSAVLPHTQLVLSEMISRPFSDPNGTAAWTARANFVARLGEECHLPVAHFQQAMNES